MDTGKTAQTMDAARYAYIRSIIADGRYAIIASDDMNALRTSLQSLGYEYFDCRGVWENVAEDSVLIPRMAEDAAIGCGIAHKQNAVIVNGACVECRAPFTRTEYDLSQTVYGALAYARSGYTECAGIVWSLTEWTIPAAWQLICSNGNGRIYRQENGQYAAILADGSKALDCNYSACDRMISGTSR